MALYTTFFNDLAGQNERKFNRLRYMLWVYKPYLESNNPASFQSGAGWRWMRGSSPNIVQIYTDSCPEGLIPDDLRERLGGNLSITQFLQRVKLNHNHFNLSYWINKLIQFEGSYPQLRDARIEWEDQNISNEPVDPSDLGQITFPIIPLNNVPFARSPSGEPEIWMVVRYTAVQAFIFWQDEVSRTTQQNHYRHIIDEANYKNKMRELIISGHFLGDPSLSETERRAILEKKYTVSSGSHRRKNKFADIVVMFPNTSTIVIIEAKIANQNYNSVTPDREHKDQLITYTLLERLLNSTSDGPPNIISYLIYFSWNGVSFWKLDFETYTYELIANHQVA